MASMKTLPILIVEDDADLREALIDTLQLAGYDVVTASDGLAALEVLKQRKVGLVLSDVQMKPMDGHTLLHEIKNTLAYVPVVLMTAYGMIEKAVEAIRAGACNYITKPFEPEQLLAEVARYMLPAFTDETGEVIAEDPRTMELLELARRVAPSDATVLITGESGTGKEILSRFIHRHSHRAGKPFVAINCAAIPEQLLESTLFGHEKGSFTGAATAHAGKFEQAQGGTILLDEVSEMPLQLQAKLLRVLQEREVERVGGRQPIPLDIRVLATSNRNMPEEVKAGKFREDLYYRLNVFPLELPSLRERPGDVVPLARFFVNEASSRFGRQGVVISPAAQAQLRAYSWPGNIRELENVMQRALILCAGASIEADNLYLPRPGGGRNVLPVAAVEAEKPAVAHVAEDRSGDPKGAVDMKTLERQHILETLEAVNGSRKNAAERLGMSERTLRYKLQQYREEGWLEGGSE